MAAQVAMAEEERLTAAQRAICLVCMIGFMVDMGEIAISSALAAIFSSPEKGQVAGTVSLALLLASTYAGGAIGAIAFGALSRRLPLRMALLASMLLLAAASFAAAMAPDIMMLTAARLVSGLAIGAYPPLAIALLTNHLPPQRRGSLILLVSAIGTLGPLLTIYATARITETDAGFSGWQIVLVGLGLAALLTALGFALLRGIDTPAEAAIAPVAEQRPDKERPLPHRSHALLATLYAAVPWSAIGFPMLSGAVLVSRGFPLINALWFVGIVMSGPTLGSLLSALVVDRLPRRTMLFLILATGALCLTLFAFAGSPWLLGAASVVFGMALGLFPPMLSLYAAELFPTEQRVTATARLWALSRVSMIAAPLCLLPLLRGGGPMLLTLILAAILAACAALMRFAPRGFAKEALS